MIKEKYGIQRASCNDGTCPKAVSLVDAVRIGCVQCVKKHISEAGQKYREGMTALMIAAKLGHLDAVQLLVEKEARMQDNESRTALMYAIMNKHPECVPPLLIEAGMRGFGGIAAMVLSG